MLLIGGVKLENRKTTNFTIANFLTCSRILLTIPVGLILLQSEPHLILIWILSICVFLTDFLDGKIARKLLETSKRGAKLDVIADLFFILTFMGALFSKKLVSIIFILLPLISFVVFVVTSNLQRETKTNFWFDIGGKSLAAIFYVIPLGIYSAYYLHQEIYTYILEDGKYFLIFSTLAVTIYRIGKCIQIYVFD